MVSPVGGGAPTPHQQNVNSSNGQWIQEIEKILEERHENPAQGLADLKNLISQIEKDTEPSPNVQVALSYLDMAKEQWSSGAPNVVSAYLTEAVSYLNRRNL